MNVNLEKDKLIIKLKFDLASVGAIRSIDGRKWNPIRKRWEVPAENIEDVFKKLQPLGFVFDSGSFNLRRKLNEKYEKLQSIKDNPGEYKGHLPLFDFQKKGAAFLQNSDGALLADVPGLGKTIQVIAANEGEDRVLVFCPATLKYNWKTEILKWQPNAKVVVIDGNKKERALKWSIAQGPRISWVIANYELLIHDFDLIKDFNWPVIVCDEATRISNPQAKSVKALKELTAEKKIALTGTPVSNSPGDIFSIIDWIAPRYLGSYYQFRAKYCVLDEVWGRVVGFKNLHDLSEKIDRFILRRTKEEVFKDFPRKVTEDVPFELSEDERKLYDSIKEEILYEIRALSALDTRTLSLVPVKMLRLKQCTDHPRLIDGKTNEASKLSTLKDLLRPILASNEKAIIFTQFAEMLQILQQELADYRPVVIYGAVDNMARMERVKEFNDDPNGRVLLMTEAGAYGLNIQSASYVIHYDSPWSVAKLDQREGRAHRIGQNKSVTVYNLIAKNTIDEYVMKILHHKQKMSAKLLDDAERMEKAGLSVEDINNILRL